ncbi:YwmB family TATA-box binding protein [Paucisalibacillus sp. EB02]|uniref:YwmB family TATA-box binding protein n=1 Tax=Paucisalibacillus sp. EB02 TaxID=1347087 RepID=UPI0004B6D4ED|nr:YwmB family TATA-box binding protein [Paucisalibacillus sp. EB02]
MKRILVMSVIILLLSNTVFAMEHEQYEIIDIANIIMLESDLEIESWEVTLKENMDSSRLEVILQDFSSSYSVTKEENENSIIYLVSDTHKKGNINVMYNVIFPKEKQYQAELVVSIKGSSWDENVASIYRNMQSNLTNKYFTKDVKIFSCMSTRTSAIIENDYVVQSFTEKLNLRQINVQRDTINSTRNVEIVYGYTSGWGQKITIQDRPVNVQIVTRNLGNGDVQYLIGTPILINEY